MEAESESKMVVRMEARTFTQFHSEFNVYQCQIIMIFHFSFNDERPFKVVQLLRLHGSMGLLASHEYGLTHISSAFVCVFFLIP